MSDTVSLKIVLFDSSSRDLACKQCSFCCFLTRHLAEAILFFFSDSFRFLSSGSVVGALSFAIILPVR